MLNMLSIQSAKLAECSLELGSYNCSFQGSLYIDHFFERISPGTRHPANLSMIFENCTEIRSKKFLNQIFTYTQSTITHFSSKSKIIGKNGTLPLSWRWFFLQLICDENHLTLSHDLQDSGSIEDGKFYGLFNEHK